MISANMLAYLGVVSSWEELGIKTTKDRIVAVFKKLLFSSQVWFQNRRTKWRKRSAADMATIKPGGLGSQHLQPLPPPPPTSGFIPGSSSIPTKSSIASGQSSPRPESHANTASPGTIEGFDDLQQTSQNQHPTVTSAHHPPPSIPPHFASAFLAAAASNSMHGLPFPFGMFPMPPRPGDQEERLRLFGSSLPPSQLIPSPLNLINSHTMTENTSKPK